MLKSLELEVSLAQGESRQYLILKQKYVQIISCCSNIKNLDLEIFNILDSQLKPK